jgi:flagellar motility protein MotE (MotC chaperone)
MKASLFSTGLIALITLLAIKGLGLISSLSQNSNLGNFAIMSSISASTPNLALSEKATESTTQTTANIQPDMLEPNEQTKTKVVINNKVIPEYTKQELEVFGSLAKLKTDLDAKQQNIELKEVTLIAIEDRLNQKIQQLKLEQEGLKKIMESYSQKQNAEIKSLANIYSNMKPKEAAAIFDQLDMPLLVKIVGAMKERNIAQIVAQMNTSKVKELSTELSKSSVLNKKDLYQDNRATAQ